MFRKIAELLSGRTAKGEARAELLARDDAMEMATPEVAGPVTALADVMTGAFEPGFIGEAGEKRYPLRAVSIGDLNLPSGRLVLADPFIVSGHEFPLDLELASGRYPVDIAVADAGKSGQRVALARLSLSAAPPVRWVMAVTEQQDLATLKGDEIFGFGVDAGTGAFIDAGTVAWLGKESFDEAESRADDWQARGEALGPVLGIPYGFVLVEEAGPGGVAMFSSGWGDGHYAAWVGYDAADRPAQVVIDFAVITAVHIPKSS
jgi:hypothetical protein